MKITLVVLFLTLFSEASQAFIMQGSQVNSVEIEANSVVLGADTSGSYVESIEEGSGISSTGANTGEAISHTISVDQSFEPTWTGIQTFTPSGTKDIIFNVDADSSLRVVGTSTAAGTFLCLDASNNLVKCATANSIALGTDTTGNYVATITSGTNISVSGSGSETAAVTVNTVANPTFATHVSTPEIRNSGDINLAPGNATTLALEADGDATLTGNFTSNNISGTCSGSNTGDQTITLTGDVSGSGTGSFAATIQANSVALTTDTTGNYVGTIAAGTGISTTGAATGEGISHSISVDQTFSPTWTGTHTWFGTGAYVAQTFVLDHAGDPTTRNSTTIYTTTGMAPGELSAINFTLVDTANSTGGQISINNCQMVSTGSADVACMFAGGGVFPVVAAAGSPPAAASQAWRETSGPTFTSSTAAFGSAGTDVQIFVNDNDSIYVGESSSFFSLQVALATPSSANISAVFQFWNGSTWVTFVPTDGTAGFTRNGNIEFNKDALIAAGWVANSVNSVSKYYIRIQRTENTIVTPPTEDTIILADGIQNQWDPDGLITVQNIKTQGTGDNDIAGKLQLTGTTTSHEACNADNLGKFEMFDNGANKTSLCICEKTGAASYSWGAVTSGGSC